MTVKRHRVRLQPDEGGRRRARRARRRAGAACAASSTGPSRRATSAGQLAALPTIDVVVVLGGDGTFLRAARAVAEVDVPIVGVNLGKVGFLSKAEAHELEAVLDQVVAGDYRIEERMALEGRILRGAPADRRRTATSRSTTSSSPAARWPGSCRLDVAIDGTHLATFIADGLVVSSPTGSTGYTFSAGGPILDPVSRNLIVTPIAAYLSAFRSVVVSPQPGRPLHGRGRPRGARLDRRARGLSGSRSATWSRSRAVDRPIRLVEPAGALPFWDLLRHKVELLPS